jgi:hypothetical protein
MIKERLFDIALEQFNEVMHHCPWFDEKVHHYVTIEDMSSNIQEFIGIGTTFNNTKPALIEAFDRLSKNYNSQKFTVGYYHKGRLKSFCL